MPLCGGQVSSGAATLASTSPTMPLSRLLSSLFSSRRRHTRLQGDWSSDVCSSDLILNLLIIRKIFAKEKPDQETLNAWHDDPENWVIGVRSEERRVGKECRSRW